MLAPAASCRFTYNSGFGQTRVTLTAPTTDNEVATAQRIKVTAVQGVLQAQTCGTWQRWCHIGVWCRVTVKNTTDETHSNREFDSTRVENKTVMWHLEVYVGRDRLT